MLLKIKITSLTSIFKLVVFLIKTYVNNNGNGKINLKDYFDIKEVKIDLANQNPISYFRIYKDMGGDTVGALAIATNKYGQHQSTTLYVDRDTAIGLQDAVNFNRDSYRI